MYIMASIPLQAILYMYNTKNDKHRIVPVSDEMKVILQKYCMTFGLSGKNEGWLFPSQLTDSHISAKAIKHRFEIKKEWYTVAK